MASYAIGDLQGCYDELLQLMDKIGFDTAIDRIYFVGDLVNRGPKSLECLRFVKKLGHCAVTVLGNHDLCLIASYLGIRKTANKDTLDKILKAPDCDELLFWLRNQPLLYRDKALGFTMVHAGLAPQWTIQEAAELANEVENYIRGPDYQDFFKQMYGNQPIRWSSSLQGIARLRFIVNAMTRIRYCTTDGELDFACKGAPGSQPTDLIPWFNIENRASLKERVIIGHWSTLGKISANNVYALDTGCVWGGKLTAMRLDTPDPEYISVNSATKLDID